MVKQSDGFLAGYWTEPHDGKGFSVVLFDTEENARASAPPAGTRPPGAPVVVGHIEDAINPITARYVERVIADAQAAGAPAVVFVINTPGGLIDSTYQITTDFLNAPLPVVTYVAPSGARAASAGTFITMAGAIAAMAPATNIGAAHPVDSSGGDIQGDLRLKAENDAVAEITKIAKARGRNEQWAEDAVRNSVSIRDDQALQLKVVDLIATDLPDLLAQIDGKTVQVKGQAVTLATKAAAIDDDGMSPFETFLHFVVDPQIALLLFTIGTYGLIFELSNPGLIFPGIIGVIAIVIALFSFGTLDANAAGIALMIFALVLFIAEVKIVSHGLLLAGGIAFAAPRRDHRVPAWPADLPGAALHRRPGHAAPGGGHGRAVLRGGRPIGRGIPAAARGQRRRAPRRVPRRGEDRARADRHRPRRKRRVERSERRRSDPARRRGPRTACRWLATYRRPGGLVLRKKGKLNVHRARDPRVPARRRAPRPADGGAHRP